MVCVHRARTNKANVPDVCKTPKCMDLMPNHIVVGFELPSDGGNAVVNFMLKLECMNKNEATGATVITVSGTVRCNVM